MNRRVMDMCVLTASNPIAPHTSRFTLVTQQGGGSFGAFHSNKRWGDSSDPTRLGILISQKEWVVTCWNRGLFQFRPMKISVQLMNISESLFLHGSFYDFNRRRCQQSERESFEKRTHVCPYVNIWLLRSNN